MSNIVDFAQVQEFKKAEKFADSMMDFALEEQELLSTKGLLSAFRAVEKIVFFSGDVEEGEVRSVKACESEQLVRAAGLQLYRFELLGNVLRLVFDGDYIYDLYFMKMGDGLMEAILEALKSEHKLNAHEKEVQSL